MTTLADLSFINRALREAPFHAAGCRASTANRRALWAALLCHVHREVCENGRAALVARPSPSASPQLYVEGAQGRLRGAFRDPLGIAQAMMDLGSGVSCSRALRQRATWTR